MCNGVDEGSLWHHDASIILKRRVYSISSLSRRLRAWVYVRSKAIYFPSLNMALLNFLPTACQGSSTYPSLMINPELIHLGLTGRYADDLDPYCVPPLCGVYRSALQQRFSGLHLLAKPIYSIKVSFCFNEAVSSSISSSSIVHRLGFAFPFPFLGSSPLRRANVSKFVCWVRFVVFDDRGPVSKGVHAYSLPLKIERTYVRHRKLGRRGSRLKLCVWSPLLHKFRLPGKDHGFPAGIGSCRGMVSVS